MLGLRVLRDRERDFHLALRIEAVVVLEPGRRGALHEIVRVAGFVVEFQDDVLEVDARGVLHLAEILRGDLDGGVIAVGLAVGPVLRGRVEIGRERFRRRRGLSSEDSLLGPVRETKAGENRDNGHQQEPARASHGDILYDNAIARCGSVSAVAIRGPKMRQ